MEDSTMQEQQQFVEVNNDSFMNEAAESTKEHEEQSEQPIEEIQLEQQEQPLEEPAKQSTEQPIEQQTETSVEQQNGQPTEQPREPLVEQPTEQFNAEEMKLDEQSNPQSTDEQEQQLEDEPMEEDQAEPKKEENQQEEETMAPLLSAPASWQIPISALTQKASAPTASSNTSFTAPTAASNTVTDPPMKRAALRREKLEARIRESKYNIEAWNALINDIQQTGDLDAIRDVYERFLSVFPTSVSFFFFIHIGSLSFTLDLSFPCK